MLRTFRSLMVSGLMVALTLGYSSGTVKADSPTPALQPCVPSTTLATPEAAQPTAPVPAVEPAPPTLYVVTTVAPLTNIVFNIAGNRIKIHGLIPEGLDSHTFEPKPSDATFIAQADVIFINGLHLEEPTKKLAESNLKQGAEIIQLGTLTLSQADWVYDFSFPKDKGDPNPHLWMNPLLALNYAKIVRDTLSKRDSAGAAFYVANYATFAARLTTLDQAICNAVATIPAKQRKLLTYHDSFAYFAPRYQMTVIGAIQPADFAEPSAQEVAKLIDQLKAEGVPAIFGSEVFPSKVLDQIGKEAGVSYVNTLADDDLPNQTDNRLHHSYLQLLVNDVTTMTSALGGDPAALKAVATDNLNGSDSGVEVSGK
ncbi:MAG: metal ABC transporter substrate-binding protein [Chloroflexota bacterium]